VGKSSPIRESWYLEYLLLSQAGRLGIHGKEGAANGKQVAGYCHAGVCQVEPPPPPAPAPRKPDHKGITNGCQVDSYCHAGARQFGFMLRGLREMEPKLQALNIPFFVVKGDPTKTIPKLVKETEAALLVTDFATLRDGRRWRDTVSFYEPLSLTPPPHISWGAGPPLPISHTADLLLLYITHLAMCFC